MREIQIFCDFDGTITKEDTLNKFLRVYADKRWLDIETRWEKGEIGSRECIYEQMKLVPSLECNIVEQFISEIQLDDYFKEFLYFIKENNIDFYIVSDGFDFFIKKILEKNGITHIKIFANKLIYQNNEFTSEFPYTNDKCDIRAGMCKCNIVKKYRNPKHQLIYIGDGLSDFCVSKMADLIFAKGRLLEYCKKNNNINNSSLIGFKDFEEITSYFKKQ